MAGSIFGKVFCISTWGESHGQAIGAVVDGCPAGLSLAEEDIQLALDKRKPGQSPFATKRNETDTVRILSGIFEGKTTGTPIAMLAFNKDMRSKDYGGIADYYRPGHADYTFTEKYGFRDYRGGGRSSGRETWARVAAGAIAKKILKELNIDILAYIQSIGDIQVQSFNKEEIDCNPLFMPDRKAYQKAEQYLQKLIAEKNSTGGVVACRINGLMPGIGEPVFDKLDASLGKAMFSIGAVKAVEIGGGIKVSRITGKENNDSFVMTGDGLNKKTNHAGGILGGISDGSEIAVTVHFKPTPSIGQKQETVSASGNNIEIEIGGRHDPIVVPRAVVVVESMAALCIVDLLLQNMSSRMDHLQKIYSSPKS